MTVPAGNCHLRGRAALSERPQPERSTASEALLYSSIQSSDAVEEAMTSEISTPRAFLARMASAARSIP